MIKDIKEIQGKLITSNHTVGSVGCSEGLDVTMAGAKLLKGRKSLQDFGRWEPQLLGAGRARLNLRSQGLFSKRKRTRSHAINAASGSPGPLVRWQRRSQAVEAVSLWSLSSLSKARKMSLSAKSGARSARGPKRIDVSGYGRVAEDMLDRLEARL